MGHVDDGSGQYYGFAKLVKQEKEEGSGEGAAKEEAKDVKEDKKAENVNLWSIVI